MPYVDYNSKQMDPLLTKEEVLKEGGVHQARWRLQRKRFSVRVEFEQAGSLGKSLSIIGANLSTRESGGGNSVYGSIL